MVRSIHRKSTAIGRVVHKKVQPAHRASQASGWKNLTLTRVSHSRPPIKPRFRAPLSTQALLVGLDDRYFPKTESIRRCRSSDGFRPLVSPYTTFRVNPVRRWNSRIVIPATSMRRRSSVALTAASSADTLSAGSFFITLNRTQPAPHPSRYLAYLNAASRCSCNVPPRRRSKPLKPTDNRCQVGLPSERNDNPARRILSARPLTRPNAK